MTPDLAYCYVFLTNIRRNTSEWKVFCSQDTMVDQAMGKGKKKKTNHRQNIFCGFMDFGMRSILSSPKPTVYYVVVIGIF